MYSWSSLIYSYSFSCLLCFNYSAACPTTHYLETSKIFFKSFSILASRNVIVLLWKPKQAISCKYLLFHASILFVAAKVYHIVCALLISVVFLLLFISCCTILLGNYNYYSSLQYNLVVLLIVAYIQRQNIVRFNPWI